MSLIFFGTGTFAIPSLRALAKDVILVVTQPDRPSGRGMKPQPSPVKVAAMELGIPVESPEKCRTPEFVEKLELLQADAMVVASYGQILSQRLLDATKRGGINLHGSILPKYRGAAPIQRAIQNLEAETGIALMQMDKGMDSGDIIEIVRTDIGPEETYGELQNRLSDMAATIVSKWIPRILSGDYSRIPQDHEQMTLAPKIEKSEGAINLFGISQVEYAKVRAFSPPPGSFLTSKFGILKIVSASLGTGSGLPGVVLSVGDGIEIALQEGSLILQTVQPEGKKKMSGRDFANGMRIKPGDSIV